MGNCDKIWKLLGCYGIPYRGENDTFWKNLENTVSEWMELWLLVGDLNNILYFGEKFGGKPQDQRRSFLGEFKQSVEEIDLGFSGQRFTCRIGNLAMLTSKKGWICVWLTKNGCVYLAIQP